VGLIGQAPLQCRRQHRQLGKKLHHFFTVCGVKVTSRFIGKDYFWFGHDCSRDRNALLLTTRKLLWEVVSAVHDIHALENFFNACLALSGRNFHVKKRKLHILEYCKFINQVKALENETD
jgi:hypothetical protein